MSNFLRDWWQGTYIPPPDNDPDSSIVFISPGHYERHWSARFASWAMTFARKHKLAGVAAIAAVSWAVKKLFDHFFP